MSMFARTLALVALATIVAPVAPLASLPATAAEDVDVERGARYAKPRYEAIADLAAKVLWRAAKAAFDEGFHQAGLPLAREVLEWSPDHRAARKHLGYKRSKSEWVKDSELVAEVARKNTRKANESDDEWTARYLEWKHDHRESARTQIVERYLKLARDCRSRRFEEQAERALWRARAQDPANAEAAAGLGLETIDDVWVPRQFVEPYRAAHETAIGPEMKRWEGILGRPLIGVTSKHFHVLEALQFDDLDYIARVGEVAYIVVLDIIGLPPEHDAFAGKRMIALYVDRSLWPVWAKGNATESSPAEKQVKRPSIGNYEFPWMSYRSSSTREPRSSADRLAHSTAHAVLRKTFDSQRADWVQEAIAFEAASVPMPEANSRCTTRGSRRYGGQDLRTRFADAERWRGLVRETVYASDDIPLRTILPRETHEFDLEDIAKAWSMLTWLRRRDPTALAAYIAEAEQAADHPALLEKHFGATPEELDEMWRAYVLRAY